ncbi:major capsid protein, partial [Lacticaseibacillus paracasei]
MVDIPYGTRVKNTQANSKATLRLAVPHFGEEDAVRPLDVKGKIAWEDFQLGARPETLNNVIERKQIQHRQTMVRTHELAMKQLIVDG